MAFNAFAYGEESLPQGFRFPQKYLEAASEGAGGLPDPWWFLGEPQDDTLEFWLRTLRKQYPTRALIPFAKYGPYDDIACFDFSDLSGDPKVNIVHSFASPGWEDRGSFASYEEWAAVAAQEGL